MSLFCCGECLCVENTATCNYWSSFSYEQRPVCSACDPEIGSWHGYFEKRSAVGMFIDSRGYVFGSMTNASENIEILGTVQGGIK